MRRDKPVLAKFEVRKTDRNGLQLQSNGHYVEHVLHVQHRKKNQCECQRAILVQYLTERTKFIKLRMPFFSQHFRQNYMGLTKPTL